MIGHTNRQTAPDNYFIWIDICTNTVQEEYNKFGLKIPEGGTNTFENALLLYEVMQVKTKINYVFGVKNISVLNM